MKPTNQAHEAVCGSDSLRALVANPPPKLNSSQKGRINRRIEHLTLKHRAGTASTAECEELVALADVASARGMR